MEKNLFGTDGIRGKIGNLPFDINSIFRLGNAIGLWAQKKYGPNPVALIGHDTRESFGFVKSTLKSVLYLYAINIYDGRILPTPAVFKIINNHEKFYNEKHFDFGIVISASHNLYQDNGIKIFDSKNGKLGTDDENLITKFFIEQTNEASEHTYNSLGKDIEFFRAANRHYIETLITRFDHTLLQNKKIILDCANGATCDIAPTIFQSLKAEVITIHNKPNGKNINKNCGSTNPESLSKKVLQEKADIGFAFDGDGDRLTVVNQNGEIKNGDDILAFLTTHPKYKKEKTIVGTKITNYGLENWLKKQNKKLIRTDVGDKNISIMLKKNNLFLGGEQSGHIIVRDYLNCSDGIFAAILVSETACLTNNWNLKTFEKYPQVIINIAVKEKKNLNQKSLAKIITTSKKELDRGRIVVRYSGTEPALRVMVEEKTKKCAKEICEHLAKKLRGELEK